MNNSKAKRTLVEMGKQILASGLVAGTWGNLSLRLPDNQIAITPSGMNYNILKEADIVVVDLEGQKIEGSRKPSSELPTHLEIYKARTDVEAIVHTHSIYATALAVARKEIPGALEELVQIVGGSVEVSSYALPGTEELGKNVVAKLRDRNATLLANHGVFCVSKNLEEAFLIAQIVEKAAQITILAEQMGGAVELPPEDIKTMRTYFLQSYGQK